MTRYRGFILAALLVLMTLAAYFPALQAGFIWDDDRYITENPMLVADHGLQRIWFSTDHRSQYFPLTYTVFYLEHKLWGFDPLGYHLVNIVLHTVNALLLFLVIRRLGFAGAWLASAIFALHPVHVESVAWITELKNLLMTFSGLLSLWAWIIWTDRSQKGEHAGPFYLLSLFLYLSALFSKTTACTLPAALVLVLWLKKIPLEIRHWLQIAPYVLFGLVMGCLTLWWEQVHQGLHPMAGDLNLIDRVLIAGRAIWFYLGKLILPTNLTFSYPRWEVASTEFSSYFGLIAFLVAAWVLWLWREKIGREPIAAFVFFAATLSPMLGLISLFTFFWTFAADHYQYMASIGPIALAAAGVCYFINQKEGRFRSAGKAIAILLLLLLGTLTFRQTKIYENEETLWNDTLNKNPSSWLAHVNLGASIGSQGRDEEAMAHYRAALDIYPDSEHAHFNMGNVYLERGQLNKAIEHYRRALEIKPDYAEVLHNLGLAFSRQGRYDQAIEMYQQTLRLEPDYLLAHRNLALDLVETGRYEEALKHFRKVVSLNPSSPAAHRDLGNVLFTLGQSAEALEAYQQAIDLADRAGEGDLKQEILNFLLRISVLHR
ncbi:MAG: tetratricopeptide repeat protein [Planctomycetes bacterium]|nr:tetratricopeptide repeat protein [Planctomycetota bacterium]